MVQKHPKDPIDPSKSSREEYYLKGRKRGLIVRTQVDYSRAGRLLRYSFALIDTRFSIDNGRVVGYDNSHGRHHRHYLGQVEPVEFESHEILQKRFESEIRKYLEDEEI